jgi:hypothetical protein
MRTPDPTIVAMAAHEAACRRFSRAIDKCEEPNATRADQREYDAANVAERAAALALAKTLPTTKDGAKELLAYVKSASEAGKILRRRPRRGARNRFGFDLGRNSPQRRKALAAKERFSAGADAVRSGKLTPHSL